MVLSDEHVRALWRRHLDLRSDALDLLRGEIGRDLLHEVSDEARLLVVAQPVSADSRLLLDSIDRRNLQGWAAELSARLHRNEEPRYSPRVDTITNVFRRANGVALAQHTTADRKLNIDIATLRMSEMFRDVVDLEINEDGGLRLFYGGASMRPDGGGTQERVLFPAAILGETSTVIEIARKISHAAEFRGGWTFGVAMHRLRGLNSFVSASHRSTRSGWPYNEDVYQQVHEASSIEMGQAGSPVLDALLGRFCRAVLGTDLNLTSLDNYPINDA